MKLIFLKIILCCPVFLFSLSINASETQDKKESSPSPVKKEESSSSQVKKEEPSSSQVKKEESSPSPVKKEELSLSQEEETQPQQPMKKEPQKASGHLQILEIKKDTAIVKVPAHQELSVGQVIYVEPIIYPGDTYIPPPKKPEPDNKVERNGFVSLTLSPSFVFYEDFKYDDFYFDIGTNYGIVFGKSNVANAGIIEGALGLSGIFAPEKWRITFGFDVEINFIKNDGVNKIIPGLNLNASVSYIEELTDIVLLSNPPIFGSTYRDEINFLVSGGLYLKCFVLKQLALIPSVKIGYASFQKDLIGVGAGLQMRIYF